MNQELTQEQKIVYAIRNAKKSWNAFTKAKELIELLPVSIKSVSQAIENFKFGSRSLEKVKQDTPENREKKVAELSQLYRGTKEELEQELRELAVKEELSKTLCKIAKATLETSLVDEIYSLQKKTWKHRWNDELWRWEIQNPNNDKWEASTKERHQPKTPSLNDFIQKCLKADQSRIGLAQEYNLNEADINKLIRQAEKQLGVLGMTLPNIPRYNYEDRKKEALKKALGGDIDPAVFKLLQARMGIVTDK
jgi:hypothetical protein